jgi:hypothetical protein
LLVKEYSQIMVFDKASLPAETAERDLEVATRAVLGRLREERITAPAFLDTRVLARVQATLRERREGHRGLLFWKALALSSLLLAVAIGSHDLIRGHGEQIAHFNAPARKAMLVNVEVQPLETARIAYAEIDLPEGVGFYSTSHPELVTQRRLVLNWAARDRAISRFPFAILSNVAGLKKVHVRFRDSDDNLVEERSYQIQFTGPVGSAT